MQKGSEGSVKSQTGERSAAEEWREALDEMMVLPPSQMILCEDLMEAYAKESRDRSLSDVDPAVNRIKCASFPYSDNVWEPSEEEFPESEEDELELASTWRDLINSW